MASEMPLMTLEPLLTAATPIRLHALGAFLALGLGAVQLLRAKGDGAHRLIGWGWSAAMFGVALSSFAIHEIDQWRGFSVIHLLSINVLAMLPVALYAAHRGNVDRHRRYMQGLYFWGLIVAGAFTLAPGRIMHAVLF